MRLFFSTTRYGARYASSILFVLVQMFVSVCEFPSVSAQQARSKEALLIVKIFQREASTYKDGKLRIGANRVN
jgi:hypothetical protein